MRRFGWLGIVAVGLCGSVFAQSDGDIQERMRRLEERLRSVENQNAELRDEVKRVSSENSELKGEIESAKAGDLLEQTINSLQDSAATQDGSGTRMKSAASPITITGEFRFRYGLTLGDNADGTTPRGTQGSFGLPDDEHDGTWGDGLTRVGLRYDFEQDVSAYSEFRAHTAFGRATSSSFPFGLGANSQVFGGPTGQQGSPQVGEVETFLFVYQTWLEVRDVFGAEGLSTRTGRQEIVLGNQFQFGNSEWYNGFAFDGTRWDYSGDSWNVTALLFKLQSIDGDEDQLLSYFNSHDDDALFSLYFNFAIAEEFNLDVYWIYINGHGGAYDNGAGPSIGSLGNFVGSPRNDQNVFQTAGTAYYHTIGARAFGNFRGVADGLDYNLEGAYQIGEQKNRFGPEGDIGAATLEAEVGMMLNAEANLRVFARFLYASGPDGDDLAYTPLYPDRHTNGGFRARYGLWDLIPMSNVLTPQVGVAFDPAEKWSMGATVLWATADTSGVMPATRRNRLRVADVPNEDYGWEGNIWAEYRHSTALTVTGGVAVMLPDDAGQALWLVGADTQVLAFLQLRVNF